MALPSTIRAIAIENDRYRLVSVPLPKPKRGEALIKIAYAGVNRAELFQLQNKYPRPEAEPMVPGIEFSGTILKISGASNGRKIGDRVCGVLKEGAFAEFCVSPVSTLLPVPEKISLREAASLPEAILTAWISLFHQASLKKGEAVLIHGGTSGVGVTAIQMAKLWGAHVFATAGSPAKTRLCEKLGARQAINYKKEDFTAALKDEKIDVILDMVGGDYFQKNLSLLNTYGRLCMISFLRGARVEVNLAPILLKKLSVFGSLLRNRPVNEKADFVRAIRRKIWPWVASGRLKPVMDSEFPLEKAEKAIKRMEDNLNIGKILLQIAPLP